MVRFSSPSMRLGDLHDPFQAGHLLHKCNKRKHNCAGEEKSYRDIVWGTKETGAPNEIPIAQEFDDDGVKDIGAKC